MGLCFCSDWVKEGTADSMTVDRMAVDSMTVDSMAVNRMAVDSMTVDSMTVDRMAVDSTTVLDRLCGCISADYRLHDLRQYNCTLH
jgi:pentapeptide MXKDX repeat protein